ncbi:TonB-dependent receptor [Luteimonas aquatica]|uniref:TonB-dependent receptor n=1 Tax=Luteimonas aquatica TaxID=450364 RepID=UPI001F597B3B|nr:TonB-dependent receptor [Luteimonas aquatica]
MVRFRHSSLRCTLWLCAALAAGLPGLPASAWAAGPAEVRFEIAPGTLEDALEALARQGRVQLLYAPTLVAGRRSAGLRLESAPADALARLLRGSGLQAVPVNADTYLLKAAPVAPPRPRAVAAGPSELPTLTTELTTVQVTGSRIPRSDIDMVSAFPLTVITRDDIESSGKQTLFELLRAQPGMAAHHPISVSTDGANNAQQPFAVAATTSLNTLGPRATLFLVDGQRVANYGLVSSDLGGLVDLDSIPLSIVERIEILRGGASAIYGADAMAGVVNIILRTAQQGGEVTMRYGLSERGDAAERRLSFGIGHDTRGGGAVFVGGEVLRRDELLGADRGWRTADRRRDGLGDERIRLGYSYYDLMRVFDQPAVTRGYCRGAAPSTVDGCLFDPPRGASLQPETQRSSLYVHAHRPFGERGELHAEIRAASLTQRLRNAPFYLNVQLRPDHPDNPDHLPSLNYAFDDLGPIRNRTEEDTLDATAGARGMWGDWSWDLAVGHHQNRVVSRTDGLLRGSAFEAALPDYRFAGPNDPALLATISPRITTRGKATLQQVSFNVGGPWFPLPGGVARVAAGIEYGHESLRHRPDALLLNNEVTLAEQRIAIDDSRDNAALYAELNLPFWPSLQADLAARADYRQGYGHRLSPKLGLKWSVSDSFTLRGTFATGYRAPSMFELRRPNVPETFIDLPESDTLKPCAFPSGDGQQRCYLIRKSIENRDLRPETSRSGLLGFIWSPTPRLSLSVDHYRIVRRNEILRVQADDDPALFKTRVGRNEFGQVVDIYEYYGNIGRTESSGWQFDAQYRNDAGRYGQFVWHVSGDALQTLRRRTHVNAPSLDYAGYGAPRQSVLASLQWNIDHWSSTLWVRWLGTRKIGTPQEGCPAPNLAAGRCTDPSVTMVDLDVAWSGIPRWRFAANVQNLTDREPVNYEIGSGGYSANYDDPRGRYYMLSATYRF